MATGMDETGRAEKAAVVTGDRMQIARRLCVYIIGLFIMAAGVAISINSGLGVSPINSLPYVLHYVTGMRLFVTVTAAFGFYVLLQLVLLRRNFKLKFLLELVFSTLFGFFVDFLATCLSPLTLPTYAGKLAMLAMAVFIVPLGLYLYLAPDIVPLPMEGLTIVLADKLHWPFSRMKILVDVASVAIGIALCFIFKGGQLAGIREGTIVLALTVGPVTGLYKKLLDKQVQPFCFGARGPEHKEPQPPDPKEHPDGAAPLPAQE